MKLVTAVQMRELDRQTIQDDGIPQQLLMERAGSGVAEVVRARYPDPCRVVCMVGKGNNGEDARVAARLLERQGYRCTLCTTFDAATFDTADIVIDGLLGTGARSPLSPELVDYILRVNALHKPVIAIDIPSGLDATSGLSCGAVIKATCTATMARPKLGLYVGEGPNDSGNVITVDIGISPKRVDAAGIATSLVTESKVAPFFPERDRVAHKGDFGHVLVIAGSAGKMGAGILAARGALRSGAGLVTYALPETAFQKFDATLPEVMVESIPDAGTGHFHPKGQSKLDTLLRGKSTVVVGPGIGIDPDTIAVVSHLLSTCTLPMVIDADALNCISENKTLMTHLTNRCVLTPHPGEMARLSQHTNDAVQNSRLKTAEDFVRHHPSVLVLKGCCTITSTGTQNWINPTGNPGMATGGMGDVLAGVIGGLLAQGFSPEDAAVCGVFLHGLAGDLAAQNIGPQGLLAGDVADAVPHAIQSVQLGHVTVMPTIHPKV